MTNSIQIGKASRAAMFFFITLVSAATAVAQGIDLTEKPQGDLGHAITSDSAAMLLAKTVNSPYSEFKPTLTPDGKRMYFSRQFDPRNVNGYDDFEDIWYSDYDSVRSTWSTAVRMPGNLNNAGPNYVTGISKTGDTLFLGNQYGPKGKMLDGISFTVNQNGLWTNPRTITIKHDYNKSKHGGAFVSFSAGLVITSKDRDDSFGERDLYVSFINGTTASAPVNMGATLNTANEESSPFLAADNRTLYFASKGHGGFGGLDIFVTTRLDETWTNWSKPENLGSVVNGEFDEEFFSITPDKKYALFSKQLSTYNFDIFRISVNQDQKEKSILAVANNDRPGY